MNFNEQTIARLSGENGMKELGTIRTLDLRDVWAREASEFTPWLAENINELGQALGMELELEAREAAVGGFSLDLLVRDLSSNRPVVVENQLTATDHDHLGKLLTYAAGFDAGVVIWVAPAIREEHRQALEWLNQRTDTTTEFYGVVVEVLQIDSSRPACQFKPVVFPNDWQKAKRTQATAGVSSRGEAYRQYFQPLIDELRETHRITGARVAQPQNWQSFATGVSGIHVNAVFGGKDSVRAELYIDVRDWDANKQLFDWLLLQKDAIERECGFQLNWERLDDRRSSRVSTSRPGSIESPTEELEVIRRWQIDRLLILKRVFAPLISGWSHEMTPPTPKDRLAPSYSAATPPRA